MESVDIVDFAEECFGIVLFEYQKELLRKMNTGYTHRYYFKDGRIDTDVLVACLNALYKNNQ